MVLSERWLVSDEAIEQLVRRESTKMVGATLAPQVVENQRHGSCSPAFADNPSPRLVPIHEASALGSTALNFANCDPRQRGRRLSEPSCCTSESSHRSSTSCPRSVSGEGNGRIRIQVYVPESADTLQLVVFPDSPVGPPEAEQDQPKNRFTDIWGSMASTKGYDVAPRAYDPKRREWIERCPSRETRPEANVTGAAAANLKSMIERYTGISISKQRLYYRGVPLGMHDRSLRSYGIVEGSRLQLQISGIRGKDQAKPQPFSLRRCADLATAKPDGEFWPMPRWVSQSKPNLFAKVGAGLDGHGGAVPFERFENYGIYTDDSKHGARDQASLRRIRAGFARLPV